MKTKSHCHALSSDQIIQEFKTNVSLGLTSEEAKRRLDQLGRNALIEAKTRSVYWMFLDQFRDFMVLVLIGSAIIAGIIGEPEDTIAIVAIVFLNAILGFIQEYRAEKAMEALKIFAAQKATIIRNGKVETFPAEEIVVGDIVVLEAGGLVPSDLRLIEVKQLQIDEAALTGESVAVEKGIDALVGDSIPIGDRNNMAFKGTLVTYGRGVGVVVATGMHTELGHIATLLHSEESVKTPLQKRLMRFGQRIAFAVIALCAVIFLVGILRGEKPLFMFMTALSLAVAAIPEALPAVVTVLLTLGARRMMKQNALIRYLPAVETLGSVTFICTDKTGTLTQNKMRVDSYALNGVLIPGVQLQERSNNPVRKIFFEAMALNNDVTDLHGDPTEIALYEAAQTAGFTKIEVEKYLPRISEIPFSSERGKMTTVHRDERGKILIFMKGAPEQVLSCCKKEWTPDGLISLDSKEALKTAENMAQNGLRVLAFAYKELEEFSSDDKSDEIESELIFLGFAGLIDPPRPEVKKAIEMCQTASIHVVMITGDHPATAVAIAKKLGIIKENKDEREMTLTGKELTNLSLEEFEKRVRDIRVYARVSPEQKIKIVRALQDKGEFVAMTGDGVNDAPALKRANIGVAMGKIGTDVARESSHMVLLDDNFSTIVSAVSEGRRIFDNIRKFIRFALTGNSAEIWTLVLAPFVGLPIPLLPIHILWVNLVTDGLPGLALAAEPEELSIMKRPPRPPGESIFSHGLWQHTVWVGLLMATINLSVMAWAYHTGHAHWQSMVFTVLTLSQMGHVLAIRSEKESLLSQGLFTNLPLLGTVIFTFLLQMCTLYIPFFNSILKIEPLSFNELMICLSASCLIFFAVEIEKWLMRRRRIYQGSRLF